LTRHEQGCRPKIFARVTEVGRSPTIKEALASPGSRSTPPCRWLWSTHKFTKIRDVIDRAQSDDELVQRGRDAAGRGAWREAYDILTAADSAELSPEDLELIGEAASWTGPTERCIEVRERAFGAYLASGDRRSAARLALALVRGHGLLRAGSVAAGWYKRAERLLAEEPECREHGYLARRKALAAEARGDTVEAQQHLRRALEIAQTFGDRDLEALALHDEGSMLVRSGDVKEGWALIDEAAAAAAAGDLHPTATGTVYCGTISACRDLLEVRRAGEWTARFEHWCARLLARGLAGRLSCPLCRGAEAPRPMGRDRAGGGVGL
jgi:tetratricopeptide (TPR) repeat protein